MREKIYGVLKKLYGITMTVAFSGGVLPLIPFIIAMIIGGGAGGTGETVSTWLYKQYYPWVIALASIAVLIGLIAMYVGKQEGLSAKSFGIKKRFFHIEFFVLNKDKPGFASRGEIVALECNMRPPGGYTPDLINFGESLSCYEIYADVIAYNENRQDDTKTKYYSITASRRDNLSYVHNDEEIFAALERKGVKRCAVTLHVGPGTFRPVKTEEIEDHHMDFEAFTVPPETAEAINACKARGGRVVCVGSTTVRTLETVANRERGEGDPLIAPGSGASNIFIYPPYRFRVCDAMLTNFHLPQSTLLMMVSALAGRERILCAYAFAVKKEYQFFSYGDCMLII